MTNPRDTGRYDAFSDEYVDQQVRVDFAWGNIPMQPNDDRGMAQLDPELDSHIIATSSYEGFPAFIQGAPYDDTITNVEVPNLVGLTNPTAAQNALQNAGLVLGNTNSSTAGANSGNHQKVKLQSIPAGTLVNEGTTVDIVVFNYVAPAPATTGPIAGFNRNSAGTSFNVLNGDDAIMYLVGQTVKPTVGWTIAVTGTSDDSAYARNWTVAAVENNNSYNTGGTAVKITKASGSTFTGTTATGGTWTKL